MHSIPLNGAPGKMRSWLIATGYFILIFFIVTGTAQTSLPGFTVSPYFNEQVLAFRYNPEVRILINAPAADTFDPLKPVGIMLYALPNGNSIEWTIGKQMKGGDDWHYDIQHIGAQTRFLRQIITEYNLVTVYLETFQKSWPAWRSKYPDHATLVISMVDYIKNLFTAYQPFIVLSGHSGGGGLTFSFLDGLSAIPDYVQRVSFLDSNYGYDDTYGMKFVNWLTASSDHFLSVIAYNDSIALYNGQPVVSPTGGTWYRSKMMKQFLQNHFTFTAEADSNFITYTAAQGRIKFILKQNPDRQILHTVQVERNGCIQGMVSGTPLEDAAYTYYGPRVYTDLIQTAAVLPGPLLIPPRSPLAMTGSQFMQYVMNMNFEQRETAIITEISSGNIPDFLRTLTQITGTFQDTQGNNHTVIYQVMPDYLAVGSNDDFCRIPMGPISAQRLADLFGATMPTGKLVDHIYQQTSVKLAPVTYTPVGNQNELVPKFVEHNQAIESQRIAAGSRLGQLTGGTKKDVVISNLILDPARPNHVVIYGWHQLNGTPIQPLTNIHINSYVDYSHGIRLLNNEMLLDSSLVTFRNILTDPTHYKLLSNETGAMIQPSYIDQANQPAQPKSFGIKSEGTRTIRILIKSDPVVTDYKVYCSKDGQNFDPPLLFPPGDILLENLETDSLYYIKLKALNAGTESLESELLVGIPHSLRHSPVLIVNGFDRTTSGNTRNFIIQHASALRSNQGFFDSATNEAITDGLINLFNYHSVDYILGEESTVDETFSGAEQTKIISFLRNGGNLFISGSEIAWDLDYKGSTGDKDFIHNYLKMQYLADAPYELAGVYYDVHTLDHTVLSGIAPFVFDNGTHGSYNVKWPDVVEGVNGGQGFIQYSALDTSAGFAGVVFEGLFPNGTNPGKLVTLGFPFETVYPPAIQIEFMSKLLILFDYATAISTRLTEPVPLTYQLYQNFPNPFNQNTTISFSLPRPGKVSLSVFNALGEKITILVDTWLEAGEHSFNFNAGNLSSSTYFYRLESAEFTQSRKMTLLR